MLFTEGDVLIILALLREGGAEDDDVVSYLEVLSEGVAAGEADSVAVVEAFRAKAAGRSDVLSLVSEIARLEEVLPRLAETAGFVRMVADTPSGNRIQDFLATRRIGDAVGTLLTSKRRSA